MMPRAVSGSICRALGAKTKPRAWAPASTATRASSRLVMPQTLTLTTKLPELLFRVGGHDQGLPHQEGPPPRFFQDFNVLMALDSALAHHQDPLRYKGQEPEGRIYVNQEGVQVPVVYPYKPGPRIDGCPYLLPPVHLHEGGHSQVVGQGHQLRELSFPKGSRNEKDSVRPAGPGLVELVGVQKEALGQHREGGGLPGPGQVLKAPLEELRLGEDGEGDRPRLPVGPGQE